MPKPVEVKLIVTVEVLPDERDMTVRCELCDEDYAQLVVEHVLGKWMDDPWARVRSVEIWQA